MAASGVPIKSIPFASFGFNPGFLPGGAFSNEGGSRMGAVKTRDFYAWSLGIDHNQWMQWLNRASTFFVVRAEEFLIDPQELPAVSIVGVFRRQL